MLLRKLILDTVEVRAILALCLTFSMIGAMFSGMLDAKDLLGPFATIVGFYFAVKSNNGNGNGTNGNGSPVTK